MNTKMMILAFAAACGLAAQSMEPRQVVQIPFAFEFQGKAMPAGTYEVQRNSLSKGVLLRNAQTGAAAHAHAAGWDRTPNAGNGIVFQKTAAGYTMISIREASTEMTYNLHQSRKQKEMARQGTPETVFIATR